MEFTAGSGKRIHSDPTWSILPVAQITLRRLTSSRRDCSDRQDQRLRLRVLQPEGPVIGGQTTDVQEQGHVDAELLLEQFRNAGGLLQPTGTDGPSKPLMRLIAEQRENNWFRRWSCRA